MTNFHPCWITLSCDEHNFIHIWNNLNKIFRRKYFAYLRVHHYIPNFYLMHKHWNGATNLWSMQRRFLMLAKYIHIYCGTFQNFLFFSYSSSREFIEHFSQIKPLLKKFVFITSLLGDLNKYTSTLKLGFKVTKRQSKLPISFS